MFREMPLRTDMLFFNILRHVFVRVAFLSSVVKGVARISVWGRAEDLS